MLVLPGKPSSMIDVSAPGRTEKGDGAESSRAPAHPVLPGWSTVVPWHVQVHSRVCTVIIYGCVFLV